MHARRYTHFRWGRTGKLGRTTTNTHATLAQASGARLPRCSPTSDRHCSQALQVFKKKFHDKTKNQWEDRKDFVVHPRKYTLLEMNFANDTSTGRQH